MKVKRGEYVWIWWWLVEIVVVVYEHLLYVTPPSPTHFKKNIHTLCRSCNVYLLLHKIQNRQI